jgi:hypothetical protein
MLTAIEAREKVNKAAISKLPIVEIALAIADFVRLTAYWDTCCCETP